SSHSRHSLRVSCSAAEITAAWHDCRDMLCIPTCRCTYICRSISSRSVHDLCGPPSQVVKMESINSSYQTFPLITGSPSITLTTLSVLENGTPFAVQASP